MSFVAQCFDFKSAPFLLLSHTLSIGIVEGEHSPFAPHFKCPHSMSSAIF